MVQVERGSVLSEMHSTRVVLYSFAAGDRRRVAEFDWDDENGVRLTVLDEGEGALARRYLQRGAPDDRGRRLVPAAEGPAFMRALTSGSKGTYLCFVDEGA